jgi:serine/threonine protein kinase
MGYIEWSPNHADFVGRGSFGDVYRGKVKPSAPKIPRCEPGSFVAVKVSKQSLTNLDNQRLFMRELDTMCQVVHPCCLYLISWDWIPGNSAVGIEPQCVFVTEHMHTDLGEVMEKVQKGLTPDGFGATEKSCIAFGIAFGMAYLHSMNVIHRDLKPANVLLDEKFFPRIGDFGLSKMISLESALKMTMGVGTPAYMAPEMDSEEWGEDDISGPADVFSFGMMLWELAADQRPFAKYDPKTAGFKVRQDISGGIRPDMPENVTAEMRELITACWDQIPDNRPRFDDIVNNPSFLVFEDADENLFNDFCLDLVEKKYRV